MPLYPSQPSWFSYFQSWLHWLFLFAFRPELPSAAGEICITLLPGALHLWFLGTIFGCFVFSTSSLAPQPHPRTPPHPLLLALHLHHCSDEVILPKASIISSFWSLSYCSSLQCSALFVEFCFDSSTFAGSCPSSPLILLKCACSPSSSLTLLAG